MPKKSNTPVCLFAGCSRKHYANGFCVGHNEQQRKGLALRPLRADVSAEDRFWAKVDKGGPVQPHMTTPCWEWTASRNRFGYGEFHKTRGPVEKAHRVSFLWYAGHIPDGLCVLHACDNPPCVNPSHLFVGTKADNAHDRDQKGRQVSPRGDRSGAYTRPEMVRRGETHGNAVLTDAAVVALRARFAAGGVTKADLARELGMSKTNIGDIIKGRTWRHV